MAKWTAKLKFRKTFGSIGIVLVGVCSLQAAGL